MKYKDYEGTAEELVRRKIKEIEEKEHIRVLHAVRGAGHGDSLRRIAIMM